MMFQNAAAGGHDLGKAQLARAETRPRRPRWPRSARRRPCRRPRATSSPKSSAGNRSQIGRLEIQVASTRSNPACAATPGGPLADTSAHTGSAASCPAGSSWAITEPSTNSTSEWTIDCGWITTSIWSGRRSNSQRASMISRALFIIVAESIVIFGPMSQVGMGQGVGHGHFGQLLGRVGAKRPAAGGQHDPPHLLAPPGLQGLKHGAVLAVDRQESAPVRLRPARSPAARPRPASPCWPGPRSCRPRRRPKCRAGRRCRRSPRRRCRRPAARPRASNAFGPDQQLDVAAAGRDQSCAGGRQRIGGHDPAGAQLAGLLDQAGPGSNGPTGPPPAASPAKRRSPPACCGRCCRSSQARRRWSRFRRHTVRSLSPLRCTQRWRRESSRRRAVTSNRQAADGPAAPVQ